MATVEITQADFDAAWSTIQRGEVRLREIYQQQAKLAAEKQNLNAEIYKARELIKKVPG